MKKIIVCAFVGICLLAISVPGNASAEKSLMDYVKEEYDVAEFKPFGVFGGILKGSFYELKDLSHETYRFLTFNITDDNFFINMFKDEGSSK